jgi:alpha-1,3-rhamnosyl/mannosyltransferase
MKVALGTTLFRRGLQYNDLDGIGVYTRGLYRSLLPIVEVLPYYFDKGLSVNGYDGAVSFGSFQSQSVLSLALDLPFSCVRKNYNIDIIHATDHLIPKSKTVPVVATLHDIIPLKHPEWTRTDFNMKIKSFFWAKTIHWANHLITVSNYSKKQIVQYFDFPHDHITTIPLGVHSSYYKLVGNETRKSVLANYMLSNNFFLFIGTLQPRKNLERVLDAHAMLPHKYQRDFPLVVVGRAGWNCDSLIDRLRDSESEHNVRWLDYLPNKDVRVLMQSSRALLFPSLCEGFGLPVIEAFASGLPVITSNTTSLPEVAGDAALLVNPLSTDEISQAMLAVIEDDGLCERLKAAGLLRAREFTWEKCATSTMSVYEQVIRG